MSLEEWEIFQEFFAGMGLIHLRQLCIHCCPGENADMGVMHWKENVEIFITACTGSCHFENFYQHNNISGWNYMGYPIHFVHCFVVLCFVAVTLHYNDVIMNTMASQITSLTIIYSSVYSGADQRKHQSSASLAFVNSPVTGEFPTQRASNAENVSIWWRHHDQLIKEPRIVLTHILQCCFTGTVTIAVTKPTCCIDM